MYNNDGYVIGPSFILEPQPIRLCYNCSTSISGVFELCDLFAVFLTEVRWWLHMTDPKQSKISDGNSS